MPRPSSRDHLLDAGVLAVLEQGAARTSIETLCQATGVTKGAFFHHFRDKDDFIAALVPHFAARAARSLDAIDDDARLGRAATADERLGVYLALLTQLFSRDPWFSRGCLYLTLAQEYGPASEIGQRCGAALDAWLVRASAQFNRITAMTGRPARSVTRVVAEQLLVTLEGGLLVNRTRGRRDGVRRALKQFHCYARAALELGDAVDKARPQAKDTCRYVSTQPSD